MRAGLCMSVAAAFRGLSACLMPASHGTAPLADVPYRHRRDGPPQLVIRRKHPVIPMPVLPWRRNDMIDKVGGRLGHVAAVARRADATALAGECHHERLAAACAPAAGESEALQPALEIAAELVLDVSRHGPLPGFPPGEPALKVLRDVPYGAASSPDDDARSGVPPRGRHGDGVGFAWETL